MRGINKKILISLLTTLVVFITVFATTYAWVGIFTYANTDSFKMNLKVQDLDSNYFLTISSSGKPGTFSNEVPAIDLERQIINNMYDNRFIDESDASINNIFSELIINPSTTTIEDNKFTPFKKIDSYSSVFKLDECLDYYKFDLYLSVDTKEGITETTTGIRANVILSNLEETITGTISSGKFLNSNPFKELPSNPINDLLKNIPNNFNVNSKNACRVGFSIYEPISINETYSGLENPTFSSIYYSGTDNPTYDSENNVYDLGGCLPFEQNTALNELKVVRSTFYTISGDYLNQELEKASSRGDLALIDENANLWNKREHESYLGCMDGIQTKMKISVYFWFEGWDADCLRHIIQQPITLNLTFTSGTDD